VAVVVAVVVEVQRRLAAPEAPEAPVILVATVLELHQAVLATQVVQVATHRTIGQEGLGFQEIMVMQDHQDLQAISVLLAVRELPEIFQHSPDFLQHLRIVQLQALAAQAA
jgi:hypothetical protein